MLHFLNERCTKGLFCTKTTNNKSMTKLELAVYDRYLDIVLNAKTDEAALNAVQVLAGLIEIITMRVESGVKMPKDA